MEDKNKIDELFEQGLGQFAAEPPADTWGNIQEVLTVKKRRKIVAFWRITGTAAALVLAFFSGYYMDMGNQTIANETIEIPNSSLPITDQINDDNDVISIPKESLNTSDVASDKMDNESKNNPAYNGTVASSEEQRNIIKAANGGVAATLVKSDPASNKTGQNLQNVANTKAEQPVVKTTNSYVQTTLEPGNFKGNEPSESARIEENPKITPQTLDKIVGLEPREDGPLPTPVPEQSEEEELVNNQQPETELIDEPFVYDNSNSGAKKPYTSKGVFSLGLVAAPTYAFSNVSSPSDPNTNSGYNAQTSPRSQTDDVQNSYAGGLNFNYRSNKRWEIGTGVHLNNWSQVSSNVLLASGAGGSSVSQATPEAVGHLSTGAIRYNVSAVQDISLFEIAGNNSYYLIPDVRQEFQYIEIPLNFGYYLLDARRFYFKVQAGLSGRFLTSSDVKLIFEDGSERPYNDLELQNFSLQLVGGTGFGYKLTQNLNLSLTPVIQYGLTPVNKNDAVETYFHQFLVYGGLNYRF